MSLHDCYKKSLLKIIKTHRLKAESIKGDLFNINHFYENSDYENIYNYNKKQYVALMFFLRNIRENKEINRGKGERYLSYTMALWLLRKDPILFDRNIYVFVSELGCFKDCLLMAMLAKNDNYTESEINKILLPMALSLIEDDYNIVKSFIDGKKVKHISLASKWAPREGKAFHEFIPNLQKLCNINSIKSKEKWRKYIKNIVNKSPNPTTVETLLSDKRYGDIIFSDIPLKAFNLYSNHFKQNTFTRDKFENYIKNKKAKYNKYSSIIDIIRPYIHQYLNSQMEFNDIYENKWLGYINNMSVINTCKYNIIPAFDTSPSMFMYDSFNICISLMIGILLSKKYGGIMQNKSITFNDRANIYNIKGDTLYENIQCIFKKTNKRGSEHGINFIELFYNILEYCKLNNISNEDLLNTKIILFTDIGYKYCCNKIQDHKFQVLLNKFNKCGYTNLPQLVIWNLCGKLSVSDINDNIIQINGFDTSILKDCILNDNLCSENIAVNFINKYNKFIST